MAGPRSAEQRLADTLAILESTVDAWVATAAADGVPHLVPLTFDWDGAHVVMATPRASVTIVNLVASGRARIAFGGLRDVVMMDADLDRIAPLDAAELIDHFIANRRYDPRTWGDDYVFAVLRPTRVQAWREADELAGRTLMRDGSWIG